MSAQSQIEREQQYLEEQLSNGEISNKEFNKEMKELQQDYQSAAEEAAQDAYSNELERW